ncbi:tetratricopeptide repeat protein [Nocardia sp. NPDC050697]|uniref:tetratricopeptide repeat protein n=1 Tax=Nocardia sp. NPDC050697 TaxID=3155158 RepID=UPI00340B9AC9
MNANAASSPDVRVPGYLGRILHANDFPAGTCFQAAPGVLVTAAHVLNEVGAGYLDAVVPVDALAGGGEVFQAQVARLDLIHDLAVLTTETALAASVAGWASTDSIDIGAATVVTGVAVFLDQHTHRFLDAPGSWAGGTMRDDQIPLGRLESKSVMKGMSGGPVRRQSDDFVLGVVSERYNSGDQWGQGTVWVARIEDLHPLLDGLTTIEVTGPPPLDAAVDLVLSVTDTQVRLHGRNLDITAGHAGVKPGLANALFDVRRERSRRGADTRTLLDDTGVDAGIGTVSLRYAGQLAAESFLPEPVSAALAKVLAEAGAADVPVRVGIEPGPYGEIPWEALPAPGSGQPLALHRLVTVYRRAPGRAPRLLGGPLRILVAIAAPDQGGGVVLDYERELRNVLDAVKAARHGAAGVRIVEFATTDAIRDELDVFDAHVLHLSGHGSPGHLFLETDTGAARKVKAAVLIAEAVPVGRMPPVISLAACYTDVAGEAGAPSFAAELLAAGASVVIATETSVTDRYATALFARLYQELARQHRPEVLTALSTARRVIHQQWSRSEIPRDRVLASLDEWSVVTVLAPAPEVHLDTHTDRDTDSGTGSVETGQVVPGLPQREVGVFVGRRRELRTLPTVLAGTQYTGVVLHGLGGIGKTTLAAELLARDRGNRLQVVFTGPLSVDQILGGVARKLQRLLREQGVADHLLPRVLADARDVAAPWRDRFEDLRDEILARYPVLVVLDNFEDNLDPGHELADTQLAELLTIWATGPAKSRLLITSRYTFPLPGGAQTRLLAHQVGPMTRAETFKLIWSLPALDRLDERELDRLWLLVGGHPRSLEYLDALLTGGTGRYSDITARLTTALAANPATRPALTDSGTDLDAALAATITLIADDILLTELLTRLTSAAQRLLLGASVYREPVDALALLFQIGEPDPTAAHTPDRRAAEQAIIATLTEHGITPTDGGRFDLAQVPQQILDEIQPALTEYTSTPHPPVSTDTDLGELVDELLANNLISLNGQTVFVHRSTATALHHNAPEDEVTTAHQRAADYWTWRVQVWPQDRDHDLHDLLEARHHHTHTGDLTALLAITHAISSRLHTTGAWDHETTLLHQTLTLLPAKAPQTAPLTHQLGILAQARGDYSEAERRYQQSLTIEEELGNRAGMARSFHQLGILAQDRGDYSEAERRYQQSLTISEELGDRAGMAGGFHQLGRLVQLRGDYSEAERRYQQALTINEELGDRAGMAGGFHQLGMLAQGRGDYSEAERRYQQSLTIEEELGDRAGMAGGFHQLGNLAQDRGDYSEAERRYQQSLTIFEELGDRAGMAGGFHQLGMLAQGRGDYSEAERRYQQSLTISEELGNRASMASSFHQLGNLAQDRGDYSEAERRYQQSLTISEELGDRAGMAGGFHQLGILAQDRGDYSEAERRYQQSLTINEELGNRAGMATSFSVRGEVKSACELYGEAVVWHIRALALRLELEVPQVSIDIRALRELRTALRPEDFTAHALTVMSPEALQQLHELLDEAA